MKRTSPPRRMVIPAALSARAALAALAALCLAGSASPAQASGGSAARADGPAHARRLRPGASSLGLSALRFTPGSVDATTGTAKATLTWTVTDSDSQAADVGGYLYLGVPGAKAGNFASATFRVRFDLHGAPRVKVSGTAASSAYSFVFRVPQYAQESPARWQVYRASIHDSQGARLTLDSTQLSSFGAVLTSTELIDSTPPAYQRDLALYPLQAQQRPYVYAGSAGGSMVYQFSVTDTQAGFAQGSITLAGPQGKTLVTAFANRRTPYDSSPQCGIFSSDQHDAQCGVVVRFPPGTPAGKWTVSALRLTDLAGNTARVAGLNAALVTVTSDKTLRASSFALSPDPVNDWSSSQQFYPVTLSLKVSGASGAVTAIYVDTSESGVCDQTSTTPVVSGGTLSVPLRVDQGMRLCQITGIAVTDSAGDLALYGFGYSAPDPFLLIKQLADTVPPTATSAGITPASVASSQTGQTQLRLTVSVDAPIAPVNGLDVTLYDSSGNVVTQESGGATEVGGVVTGYLPLPASMTPGTYTIGFRLTDAGYLSTTYGPGATAVPGGPLTLTVTAG